MEPNLRFWIAERQSFVRRVLQWTEILDPTNLVLSVEKIEKSRQLLFSNGDASKPDSADCRVQEAWKRSLVSWLRLPEAGGEDGKTAQWFQCCFPGRMSVAFLPLSAPLVFFSMMPARGLKSLILPQVSFHAYTSAFNIVNGNSSYSHSSLESIFVGAGAFVSSAFFGLIPHLARMRYPLDNLLVKRVLPVVFIAQVSGLNVFASRSFEPVRGIEVMDKEGNVLGQSRRAGKKAVRETALSRVVLFGTSALIPEVFMYFFKRTQVFLKNPQSLWPLKLSCTILAMGLMVPGSFSMFPQVGRIERAKLEEEIQALTEEAELFYHRGV